MAKKTTSTAVANVAKALPAALAARAAKDAGRGVSTKQEDNLVPLIYVLQSGSPQVKKDNPAKLPGAEEGDIWLRSAATPIVKGEEGILFQPCYFSTDWVEWIVRDDGGGFVGRHPTCPPEAKKVADKKNPNKVRWVLPNKHEVKETRYHVGFVHMPDGSRLPYVIPFSSTGHTVSKQWMFMLNSAMLPDGGGKAPSWAKLYRLRTKMKQNAQGSWAQFDVVDEGWIDSVADYDAGEALNTAFTSGEKEIAADEVLGPEEPAGGSAVGSGKSKRKNNREEM